MKGSEKQIKWAEDIINGAYHVLDWCDYQRETNSRFYVVQDGDYLSAEATEALRAEFATAFEKCDYAGMIIDKRDYFSRQSIIKRGRTWMHKNGQLPKGVII